MIQSYKQNPVLADQYDAIIIGSGMGGLTTGALLAKEGKTVLILEKHYTAGGFTHIFKRPGYEWDVGIHYVGEMGKKTSFSRRMSDYITNNELEWADMGDVYDRIVVGDEIFDFTKGVGNFKNKLKVYFPENGLAIDKYFDMVFAAVKANRGYFMAKALPKWLNGLLGGWLSRKMFKYSRRTTLDVLKEITDNEKLIKVLTAQYGDYGLPPSQSSFAMHALLVKHYFNGGYFPVGGSSQIVKTIDKVIEKSGGTILTNTEVDKVIIADNKAVGVKIIDGKEIYGKYIVSNTGIYNTVKKLLPSNLSLAKQLSGLIKDISPSSAHICLYVGLDGTTEELKLPKANYWVYPESGSHDDNIEQFAVDLTKELPLVYISFPSSKDPDWKNRYPNKSTIDILTVMPYNKFSKWEGTQWKKRPAEYDELKEELTRRLLEKLYELEPQTRGKVDYYELSSPLTTKKFVNYESGEIYGLEHSPKRFDSKLLKPATSLKNFFLTGQDISTAGIVGAMASGLPTATVITGKNLPKKVMKA